VPSVFSRWAGEATLAFHARMLAEFDVFLDEHAHELGVMLVEPQWGSSVAAMPWDPSLLREYVRRAQARGVLVCADEIMCGLGRHGDAGGLFLSQAWDLNVDAVTFGKAIGGGVFPLSGVMIRRGAKALGARGRSALQSHTYSGSSALALLAGAQTLNTIPLWQPHIAALGMHCAELFADIEQASGGRMVCSGQGLMWGGLFRHPDPKVRADAGVLLKKACAEERVLPYFVPAGGFMVTPLYDSTEEQLTEILGGRLRRAVETTCRDLDWEPAVFA
jgi:adenosylmethionine-8-amino-7-oxononanoate aminotransferase